MRRISFVGLCILSACVVSRAPFADAGDGKMISLFNGKDLIGWKTFIPSKDADPGKTFTVKDGELQVSGFPDCYIYTDASFKNYVWSYSWTYPKDQPAKTTMNSGGLIHIQTPHKLWPRSSEAQGRYADHGRLYFVNYPKGSKTESKFNDKALKQALKPSYEWNTTEVTAKTDGSIEVRVNGALVSSGKSELMEGPVGFQCEAARIHFKDIKIRPLN
jgi:hypothetical protein